MNIMKHSQFSSLFQLSHHVSSDKMLCHLCFTAFKRGFPKGRFQGQWGFSFQQLLLLKYELGHNGDIITIRRFKRYRSHKWLQLIHIHMDNYSILVVQLLGGSTLDAIQTDRVNHTQNRVQEATGEKLGQVRVTQLLLTQRDSGNQLTIQHYAGSKDQ